MLESHCCKCVALNMYVSVSLALVCRCGCHIICSAAFAPNLLPLQVSKPTAMHKVPWLLQRRRSSCVWHEAFWLAVFTPWITGKCDWQQNCCDTDCIGWKVELVQILHCSSSSYSLDLSSGIFISSGIGLRLTIIFADWSVEYFINKLISHNFFLYSPPF